MMMFHRQRGYQMICAHVHDFIRGTRIALPRPISRRRISRFHWDIVRPNDKAEQLVFRHLEALAVASARRRQQPTEI
jgi:hypothetical protein